VEDGKMPISKPVRLILPAIATLVLALGLLIAPAAAQQAQSANDPAAQPISEQQLLDQLGRIDGRITIPDGRAATLIQPQGRDYQNFREGTLPWIGGIAVLGMLAVLILFFIIRGRIRTKTGMSGIRLVRFNAFERFTHWFTATSFIILAITGLNLIFGKRILMPLIGPNAFSAWSQWAKYAHDFTSWAFMLGALIMLVIWIWDNLPDRYDAQWLKAGGGMFDKSGNTHPPAAKFNAGQKLIFWSVVLGGGMLSVSGIYLLFPFDFTDVNGMQLAQYAHAIIGVLMVAVILAHIYIGTVGMEGAFEAMGTGTVDLNWAKEHHSAWAEEKAQASGSPPHTAPTPTPAE
jgi:formate dehydrogenase subunit gamma